MNITFNNNIKDYYLLHIINKIFNTNMKSILLLYINLINIHCVLFNSKNFQLFCWHYSWQFNILILAFSFYKSNKEFIYKTCTKDLYFFNKTKKKYI